MAGLSPSRRKRNDFTDFFRTSTSSAPSQKDLGSNELQPAAASESEQDASGGYLSPPEGSKTIKRVATKIPFLGRSRKKSTHSVKSGVVSDATSAGYESTDFGESSTAALKKSRRFSQPASSPEHSSTSQAASSSLFFPTKLAAHFQITKSKKARKGSSKDEQSLAVPSEPRPVSFESDTSESSAFRSTTPRPTITLSPSPDGPIDDIDNLDEFDDLFTRSKLPKKPTSSNRETCTPAAAYRDMFHSGDSSVTLTPARRNTGHVSPLSPAETISDIARREARELAERTSKLKLPNTLPPRPSQAEPNEDSAETGSVIDAASSASLVNRTRSLSPASLRAARLRTKSATTTKMASKPPNIPLPLPPAPKTKPPTPPVTTPPAVDKPFPLSPSRTSSRLSSNNSSPGRRRAHTDGSLPPSLIKREAAIKSASKPSTPESEKKASSRSSADKENIDVDSLSPEQMKEALLKRIRRFEELEDQMAEMARTHASEKTTLEKRIRVLELDVHKRTNENRALVRILQTRVDKSKSSETDTASISSTKYSRMVASGSPPSRTVLSNPDDSGVESYATSGAESSLHGSTSVRKKAQRPLILSDSLYRSSLPSAKVPTKRESLYSLASTSATSSASSLLPPSPSLGGSPLSAILESPNAISKTSTTITKKRIAPIIPGESLSDDDRRLSRISRFSTSSSASSSSLSTTATSAYSANLRRGRPPSIAQVLEKGGADERFDKIQIAGVTQATATPYTP